MDEVVDDEVIDDEEVGPEHPEVIALVNSTMENFNTDSIRVTPEMYVDAIEDAMIERSTELQESPDSNGQV